MDSATTAPRVPLLRVMLAAGVVAVLDGGVSALLPDGGPWLAAAVAALLGAVVFGPALAPSRPARAAPAPAASVAASSPIEAPRAAAEPARRSELDFLVRRVIERLRATSDGIAARGHGVEAAVGEAFQKMESIATLAAQSASNIQAVSSATESLTESVAEAGKGMARSGDIAGKASGEISRATVEVEALTATAERINSVVQLIRKIAGHTNLLALNATIEAARAGEAGRGFAVVAAEVKVLATQTAQATIDIEAQIKSIQESTVGVRKGIELAGSTIATMQSITASIASSIEGQLGSTRTIASNVTAVAADIRFVSENMAGIVEASREIRGLSGKMLTASAEIAEVAATHGAEADRLLAA